MQKIINETLSNEFSNALGETNWSQAYLVVREGDVNTAYESFVAIYRASCDKTFTMACKSAQTTMPKTIWMTQKLLVYCKIKKQIIFKINKANR